MIGIFAPYQRGEVTAAALRLADFAMAQGYDVRLGTTGSIDKNVHPFWDNNSRSVKSVKGDKVYTWAKGCEKIIWFDYNSKIQHKARLTAERAKFFWVPMWHRMSMEEPPNLDDFFRIVGPTAGHLGTLSKAFPGFEREKATWCFWDSGITPIVRVFDGKIPRFYIPMDKRAVDETSLFTLRLVEELMLTSPRCLVTLDSDKTWPRRARKELKRLVNRWPGRLRLCLRTSLVDQIQHFHRHDWTFLPAVRSDLGITAMRSLACGTPVITYDVAPFSDLIRDGHRGLLIATDKTTNWAGAPIAVPSFGNTLNVLTHASSPEVMQHCTSQDWKLPRHQEQFERFWKAQFEVD